MMLSDDDFFKLAVGVVRDNSVFVKPWHNKDHAEQFDKNIRKTYFLLKEVYKHKDKVIIDEDD